MKVKIRDIHPDEGLELDDTIPSEAIGLTQEDYLYFTDPLKMHVKLDRVKDTVLAKVKVNGRYNSFCYRTLEKVERDWQDEFFLDFEINAKTEYLELDDDIRQEVVMRVPLRVLSDAEIKKEAMKNAGKKTQASSEQKLDSKEAEEREGTYRPFADLKDLKDSE